MFRLSCFTLLLVALNAPAADKDVEPLLRLKDGRFEVVGLKTADLDRLQKAELTAARWQVLLAVYVVSTQGTAAKDAMLGSYRIEDGLVRFTPRFASVPGVRYLVVFRPARLPGRTSGEEVRTEFTLPKPKPAKATALTKIYPTRDKLPENQLKFYLHFSAAMGRGEAYQHIQLLDAQGKPVDMPFLELDEELWDPDGKRFTLFIDPGRIKRGVKPREEVGPALLEGKSYTLVVNEKWTDATGYPLKETVRKAFRVVAPDDVQPDPKNWKIEAPPAGASTPLKAVFPKPLDHALLQRLLWVTDAQGKRVEGTIQVSDEETRWHFTPQQPWREGMYDLVVDTTLEDLAGNSVGRPFEVDLFRPIQRGIETETVKRAFQVRAAGAAK